MAEAWEIDGDAIPLDQFHAAAPPAAASPAPAEPIPDAVWDPAGPAHPVAGPSGSLLTDVGRRAGTALVETAGSILGTPRAAAQGIDWLAGKAGYSPAASDFLGKLKGFDGGEQFPTPEAAREGMYRATGQTEYVPETYGGRLGQAAINAAPMALTGGAGALRSVPAAMAGGATSEAAGEWAADHGWTPAQQFFARLVGGAPGAIAGNAVANRRLPLGAPMDPGKAQLTQMATDNYNIPIGIGNATDNRFIKGLYSESGKLPFSGAAGFHNDQQNAFIRAVSNAFGENADRITPDVINQARTRLGQQFQDFASRSGITADPQVATDLRGVIQRMPYAGLNEAERDSVRNLAQTMVDQFDPATGRISGDAYLRLTRDDSPFEVASNSGSANVREFSNRLRGVLDDALERSANPDDVDALRQARTQWKALKTVEPLTVQADAHGIATPSTGEISPARLRAAVNQSYDGVARAAPGDIPLNDLARIGQNLLKDAIPDSGTAQRSAALHTLGAPAAAIGALMAGEHIGLPLWASAGAGAATLGSGAAVNSVLRNQPLLRREVATSLQGLPFGTPGALPSALFAAHPNIPFSLAPQEQQ